MTKNALRSYLIAIGTLLASIAYADAPRQLMWEDLAPKLKASENPFAKLTQEQLSRLVEIDNTRERKARADSKLSPLELENEQTLTRKLEQAGIDVNGLLAKRKEMVQQQRARGKAVNSVLDGQIVRMPRLSAAAGVLRQADYRVPAGALGRRLHPYAAAAT